ncbi:hypothetical protein QAD02_007702 [Eretmocerus hayati]|uniref:Uncharacterized protein n=1 Tax=Eretmocerus hayati TaxID=131215 RepID=A0ACC2N4D9_9HYME|nr:hypothetical protein QAD02_007702 [Eretmocerus hayati]
MGNDMIGNLESDSSTTMMTEADDTTASNVNTNEHNFTCMTTTAASIISRETETFMNFGNESATDTAIVINELTGNGESNERTSNGLRSMINENSSNGMMREMNDITKTEKVIIMIENDPPTERRRKPHDAQGPSNGSEMMNDDIATGQCIVSSPLFAGDNLAGYHALLTGPAISVERSLEMSQVSNTIPTRTNNQPPPPHILQSSSYTNSSTFLGVDPTNTDKVLGSGITTNCVGMTGPIGPFSRSVERDRVNSCMNTNTDGNNRPHWSSSNELVEKNMETDRIEKTHYSYNSDTRLESREDRTMNEPNVLSTASVNHIIQKELRNLLACVRSHDLSISSQVRSKFNYCTLVPLLGP